MKRRDFIAALGGAAAWPAAARGQPVKTAAVGFLASGATAAIATQLAGIRDGLREAGFVEGRNLAVELRAAESAYDKLPAMAADLVARKVDVIVAQAPPAARAAKAATSTIPIVFGIGVDPVAEGLVASLARPGGNLTGIMILGSELMAKRFDLIVELMPKARSIALLVNPRVPNPWIGEVEDVARAKGVRLLILRAATVGELHTAFEAITRGGAEALVVGEDSFLSQRAEIAQFALRARLPSIGLFRRYVTQGGLTSYGASLADAYRQIGLYAGQILRGARPADLPVRRPTKFEFVLNLKTAAALGLTVPTSVLAQATEVIE